MARLKNKRWELFAKNYVANGFNATRAARSARYGVNSCGTEGFRLLKNATVIARINEICAGAVDLLDMSLEETVSEINKMAQFNVKDLYDEDGVLIPIQDLDDESAASVNEIEHDADVVVKVKAGKDKMSALDKQLRIHNAYEEHEKSGGGVINVYLDEVDLQA